jgi:predicted transcriptional regulator
VSHPTRAEAPSTPTSVRLSPAELERVNEAARVNHQTPSQFKRDALVTAAAECLDRDP